MRSRQRLVFSSIVVLGLLAFLSVDLGRLVLAPTREDSTDAVRIRNAMVAKLGTPDATAWTPGAVPASFNWESEPAPDYFVKVVQEVLPSEASNLLTFEKAIRLAYHLRASSAEWRRCRFERAIDGPIPAHHASGLLRLRV